MIKIAIIGAGIAGLTAANRLKDFADITVFEKARGVSGRMSTRYADPYFFDHGAQYFTVKTPEFASFIEPMLSQDIIKRWNANFVEIKDRQIISRKKWDDDFSHYIGCPNMNAMPQFLAKGLDIRLNTRITLVTKVADKWQLFDSNDTLLGEYDWVVYAIPVDQLKELLPTTTDFYSKIKDTKMSACLSLMLGFEGSLNLDFDAALINDDTISWISVNSCGIYKPCSLFISFFPFSIILPRMFVSAPGSVVTTLLCIIVQRPQSAPVGRGEKTSR